MSFDEFLSKVKSTSVDAMDKAKDTTKRIATVNDLKSQIRTLKNNKNKLFTQMGMELYISKTEDRDISDKIDMFVKNINRMNDEIDELKQKLDLIEDEK